MRISTISVIIPTHNRESELRNLLSDVEVARSQTSKPIEVIVVDSDLGEGSDFLEEKVYKTLSVRRVITVNSLAAKRNAGACAAQGDLLVFLDDDVRITSEDFLGLHVKAQEVMGGAVISGGITFPAPWVREQGLYAYKSLRQLRSRTLRAPIPIENFVAMNFSIPAKLYERLGGFNEEFDRYGGEDLEFAARANSSNHMLVQEVRAEVTHEERRLTPAQYARKMYDFGHDGLPLAFKLQPSLVEESWAAWLHPIWDPEMKRLPIRHWLFQLAVTSSVALRCSLLLSKVADKTQFPLMAFRVLAALAVARGYNDFVNRRERLWTSTWGSPR